MDAHAGVRRMLTLLRMLPDPRFDPEAWESLWRQVGDVVGGRANALRWADTLAQTIQRTSETPPENPEWVRHATLLSSLPTMYLDAQGETRARLDEIFDAVATFRVLARGAVGRRWLDDLLSTAWDVQVALMDMYSPRLRAQDLEEVRNKILYWDRRRR